MITKLAGYKNPPGAEHELMRAVYCLIEGEDYNKWSDAQAALKNADKFKTQLSQVVIQDLSENAIQTAADRIWLIKSS